MFIKAAKAAAQAVGIIEEDELLEDQPETIGELINQQLHPTDSRIPATVGLVKGEVFDPQVDYDLLTEVFGVHKGVEKKRMFSCPNCDREHSEVIVEHAEADFDFDAEAVCEEDDCGYEGTVGDFYDGLEESIVTSRQPTPAECNEVLHGQNWRNSILPWNVGDARVELNEYFNQLNGHVSPDLSLDWGSKQTLHPLPQAEVVDLDEDDVEDE